MAYTPRLVGPAELVDHQAAALDLHLGVLEADPLEHGDAADAEQQLVGLELQRLALRRHRASVDDPALDLDLLDAGRHVGGDPLLAERLVDLGGDLGILEREDAVEQLDDGDLGAEAVEDRRELHADRAGAEDQEPSRDLRELECVVRVDDPLAVGLDVREVAAHRAGGEDDVLRLTLLDAAVGPGELHEALAEQLAGALDPGDLVLLEQELDPL